MPGPRASAEKLRRSAKEDGLVDIHAGIASNYPQFLANGALGGRGQMGPGSKVILAARNGDSLSIVGYMPYAGVRPGTFPAAYLIARADQATPFPKPLDLSMAEIGMTIPNLPFAIARDSNTDAFGQSPALRRILWNATHRLAGWPTE